MQTFPKLKTKAVAQYPLVRRLRYESEAVRFLDGSEQRYRAAAGSKQWVIQLELLDDQEMHEMAEFFATNQGEFGTFAFVDPADGTVHESCSLDQESIEFTLAGEMRGETVLVVRQNR